MFLDFASPLASILAASLTVMGAIRMRRAAYREARQEVSDLRDRLGLLSLDTPEDRSEVRTLLLRAVGDLVFHRAFILLGSAGRRIIYLYGDVAWSLCTGSTVVLVREDFYAEPSWDPETGAMRMWRKVGVSLGDALSAIDDAMDDLRSSPPPRSGRPFGDAMCDIHVMAGLRRVRGRLAISTSLT